MYNNFKPTIWSSQISRDLEKALVFAENTNRQYEGDVKKMGDSVRILGVSKPTIFQTNKSEIALADAEYISDTSVTMPINNIAYFNFKVDDIDARQAPGGLMDVLNKEATEALCDTMDKHIADIAKDKSAVKSSATATAVTADNILSIIDAALLKLYENDVSQTTKITLTVDPKFYMLLREAYIKLDTDNSGVLKNGFVGKYGNVDVKMSNNVAVGTEAGSRLIQLKTDRAIAFCNPVTHIEAYRPENSFSDAVKGYVLYNAKLVRPKEMVVLNVKYS